MISNIADNEFMHALDTVNATQNDELTQMTFGDVVKIRDLRSHSTATVIALALLLSGTVCVRSDRKRKNFYEVIDNSRVYYIHVSPVTGVVYLLAVWKNAVAQSKATLKPAHHTSFRKHLSRCFSPMLSG